MNSVADSVESMESKHNVRPIGRLLNTMPTFQPVLPISKNYDNYYYYFYPYDFFYSKLYRHIY